MLVMDIQVSSQGCYAASNGQTGEQPMTKNAMLLFSCLSFFAAYIKKNVLNDQCCQEACADSWCVTAGA